MSVSNSYPYFQKYVYVSYHKFITLLELQQYKFYIQKNTKTKRFAKVWMLSWMCGKTVKYLIENTIQRFGLIKFRECKCPNKDEKKCD